MEKVAFVEAAFGLANVTVPGPLVLLQVMTSGAPLKLSSVTEPDNVAVPGGRLIV